MCAGVVVCSGMRSLFANLLPTKGRGKPMTGWARVSFAAKRFDYRFYHKDSLTLKRHLMSFFSPNIGAMGRLVRGVCGLGCGAGAWFFRENTFVAVTLAGSCVFMLFEAFKGWCVARACGLKTPL